MDAHFRSFAQLVVARLVADGTGLLAMEPFGGADGVILKSRTVQPLDCLHYALNLPTPVVITGIDSPQILEQAFTAAKTFKLMDTQEVAGLLARTQEVAMTGRHELFRQLCIPTPPQNTRTGSMIRPTQRSLLPATPDNTLCDPAAAAVCR